VIIVRCPYVPQRGSKTQKRPIVSLISLCLLFATVLHLYIIDCLLKLGDVFREVVDHKFRILQDDIGNESVLRRLYLQLLLRLRPSNDTRSNN